MNNNKIIKVVHLADIHIRTFRLHDEYKESFKTLIRDLRERLKGFNREEVRIVIAGDLVHQKIVVSNELLLLTTWFLKKLEEIAPVIIIPGNHDLLENNKDRVDSITPMVKLLEDKEINYFKESKCYLDNNIVWCVYSILEESNRPNIESARLEFGDDKTYIGLFHGPIINAKTDLGYVIEHGYGLDMFKGNDIVMMGDIHKRNYFTYSEKKEIDKNELVKYISLGWVEEKNENEDKNTITKNIPIVFSGSLIQQNFGESISKHGYLLWDVNKKTFEEIDIPNKTLYYKFEINSVDDIINDKEILVNE